MSERKNLTIIQVKEIQKVGDKQIPKLSFMAKDGDREQLYFTFKSSLFELIKEGQTINADVETEERGEYTNRKIVQIYVNGQPVGVKKEGYRGKSPEELELSARAYALSYSKDCAVANLIPMRDITKWAQTFHDWLKGNGKPTSPAQTEEAKSRVESQTEAKAEAKTAPTGIKVQNIPELKGLLAKHKIGTREAYEILSIGSFMELVDLDKAWADIKAARKIDV